GSALFTSLIASSPLDTKHAPFCRPGSSITTPDILPEVDADEIPVAVPAVHEPVGQHGRRPVAGLRVQDRRAGELLVLLGRRFGDHEHSLLVQKEESAAGDAHALEHPLLGPPDVARLGVEAAELAVGGVVVDPVEMAVEIDRAAQVAAEVLVLPEHL